MAASTHLLAGMALGLGASASWALANVAVQRAGRAVGTVRALRADAAAISEIPGSPSVAASPVARPRSPRWLLAAAGAAVGFGVLVPVMGRLVPVLGSVRIVGAVYLADMALGLPVALAYRV